MIINYIQSEPIELNGEELESVYADLQLFLEEINEKSKHEIWGKTKDFGQFISGSFGAFISKRRHYGGEFLEVLKYFHNRGITKFNDIDVMIPVGSDELLRNILTGMDIPHRKVSTQVHSIAVLNGKAIQVDFAIKTFDKVPNEFTRCTSFWSVYDQNQGVKSVYHQLLLGSLTAVNHDVDALSIAYGLRKRDDDPANRTYETDLLTIAKRLFNRVGKDDGQDDAFKRSIIEENGLGSFYGICHLMKSWLSDGEINRVLTKFEHRLEGLRKTEKYDKAQELAAWKIIDRSWRIVQSLGNPTRPQRSRCLWTFQCLHQKKLKDFGQK